jgi:hypothetical protein
MDSTIKAILGEAGQDPKIELLDQIRRANLALNDKAESLGLAKELGPLIYQIHAAEEQLSKLLRSPLNAGVAQR